MFKHILQKAKYLFFVILIIMTNVQPTYAMTDEDSIARQTQTVVDSNGEIKVTLDWLRRPGEFALTIEYWGYLTQEGKVNAWLSINGVQREFITLTEELPNRHQRIRIISFHPSQPAGRSKRLKKIPASDVVDYPLFRNAPYYAQFGKVSVELKFFANGRWDGDGNRGDENYHLEFLSPVKNFPPDHF